MVVAPALDVPIAHVDDARSIDVVVKVLRAIHGAGYDFAVGRWSGPTRLAAPDGKMAYRFVVDAAGARAFLRAGDLVRGPSPGGPYRADLTPAFGHPSPAGRGDSGDAVAGMELADPLSQGERAGVRAGGSTLTRSQRERELVARETAGRGESGNGGARRGAAMGELAILMAPHVEAVWPGDVLVTGGSAAEYIELDGEGIYFEVAAEATAYRAPALALLRHLPDRPRGCAAYEGAFRREALPPERGYGAAGDRQGTGEDQRRLASPARAARTRHAPTSAADYPSGLALAAPIATSGHGPAGGDEDRRGQNRVNEHTLDMRYDRMPGPTAHYHGPVPCGSGRTVAHSETAIVLRRAVYGLPDVGGSEAGHAVIFRRPAENPSDTLRVPLRSGSIVVTPATDSWLLGHRFENAFAMLVAIPGFVAPTSPIPLGTAADERR